jgi:hypothetical protein
VKHLKSPGILLGIIAVVLAIAGTATATSLINGQKIKEGSIPLNRLSNGTQALIAKAGTSGTNGKDGAAGGKGETGAKGADGTAGPKGDKGDHGDNGTKGQDGILNITQDGATPGKTAAVKPVFNDFKGGDLVRDLDLAAGSYDIEATMSVRGPDDTVPASPNFVRCNLSNKTADTEIDTFFRTFRAADLPNPGDRVPLNIGALVTFTVPTTVEVRCYTYRGDIDPAGHVGSVPSSKLIATKVQSITTQP